MAALLMAMSCSVVAAVSPDLFDFGELGGGSPVHRTRTLRRGVHREATFIPASSPSAWFTGRTRVNDDEHGSRSFDWEGTQLWLNVAGASRITVVINATPGLVGRFVAEVDGLETSSFWVGADPGVNEYLVVGNFQDGGNYPAPATNVLRIINVLEPAMTGRWQDGAFTLLGWKTDGLAASTGPGTKRRRKIELLGDSLSAGYGSRGTAGLNAAGLCAPDVATSGNYYTYNWQIAERFEADLVPIAWSGKGMYRNCCDNVGEVLPDYWRQTFAGTNASDWDFSRFIPDMLLINLGTNDFGHDGGAAWEANFSSAYTKLALDAGKAYSNPKLPIFVALGPFENLKLGAALNVSIAAINAAGGNAVYLDIITPTSAAHDGCGGHPGLRGHAAMADRAIPQIASKMGWQ